MSIEDEGWRTRNAYPPQKAKTPTGVISVGESCGPLDSARARTTGLARDSSTRTLKRQSLERSPVRPEKGTPQCCGNGACRRAPRVGLPARLRRAGVPSHLHWMVTSSVHRLHRFDKRLSSTRSPRIRASFFARTHLLTCFSLCRASRYVLNSSS